MGYGLSLQVASNKDHMALWSGTFKGGALADRSACVGR